MDKTKEIPRNLKERSTVIDQHYNEQKLNRLSKSRDNGAPLTPSQRDFSVSDHRAHGVDTISSVHKDLTHMRNRRVSDFYDDLQSKDGRSVPQRQFVTSTIVKAYGLNQANNSFVNYREINTPVAPIQRERTSTVTSQEDLLKSQQLNVDDRVLHSQLVLEVASQYDVNLISTEHKIANQLPHTAYGNIDGRNNDENRFETYNGLRSIYNNYSMSSSSPTRSGAWSLSSGDRRQSADIFSDDANDRAMPFPQTYENFAESLNFSRSTETIVYNISEDGDGKGGRVRGRDITLSETSLLIYNSERGNSELLLLIDIKFQLISIVFIL